MAASRGTDNYRRRSAQQNSGRRLTNTYIDGNVVRRVEQLPEQPGHRQQRPASARAKRNREKALRMNLPYVAFLTAASIATVCVCVNFLQLQAQGITYRNQIASLESRDAVKGEFAVAVCPKAEADDNAEEDIES